MAEIEVLKKQILTYHKTKEVFTGYKASKYSKKYLAEHEADISTLTKEVLIKLQDIKSARSKLFLWNFMFSNRDPLKSLLKKEVICLSKEKS